jgi:putative transcriptional regulator
MEALHYKSCGLENVFLLNGYEVRELEGSRAIAIHDLQGLHRAIAEQLIEKPAPLTGKEFRFLRVEMDFSQKALGDLLGVTDQAVAKWEKGQTKKLPNAVNTLIRLIGRECLLKRQGSVFEFAQELAELDQHVDGYRLELTETEDGWKPTSSAA